MSLESAIRDLIEAVKANTAALSSSSGEAVSQTAASEPSKPNKVKNGKGAAVAAAPKGPDFPEVKAAVVLVRDTVNKAAALKVIREVGKASELAAIKPERYTAVLEACEAAINGEGDAPEGDEDDSL